MGRSRRTGGWSGGPRVFGVGPWPAGVSARRGGGRGGKFLVADFANNRVQIFRSGPPSFHRAPPPAGQSHTDPPPPSSSSLRLSLHRLPLPLSYLYLSIYLPIFIAYALYSSHSPPSADPVPSCSEGNLDDACAQDGHKTSLCEQSFRILSIILVLVIELYFIEF